MFKIEVLKKMIETYDLNIKNFSESIARSYNEQTEKRLFEIVSNRRMIAAMIENEGERVAPVNFRNGNVFFDSTLYAACDGKEIY